MASRAEILASLKGQQVRVPDLQALLKEWPARTSPYLEQLRGDVDAKLEEVIPAGKRLKQMKRANVAHFTATWWPDAPYERLKHLAYVSIWLFNWDDETDSNDFSNMADHFDAGQRFRQDTLSYMRQCLSQFAVKGDKKNEAQDELAKSDKSGNSTAGSRGSQSSTSGSTAVEVSQASSSPSIGTSHETASPRDSATASLKTPITRILKRSVSTKVNASFNQHARRPSTSPQPKTVVTTKDQETGSQSAVRTSNSASGKKSHQHSFKHFTSTIAKYFRPRRDSGVGIVNPETIVEEPAQEASPTEPSRSPLILSFKTIAEGICPHLSASEHRIFLLECEKFVNATEREQSLRVKGVLPSLEEYIAMRLDTGAVAMCLALHEYSIEIQLPDSIRSDPDMAEIWLQTNTVIWVVNDMLSIKKEIAQGETDSLIPILIGQGMSLQAAMDHAFGMTQSAKWALDAAALRLDERVRASYDERICNDVKKYVDSCLIACTGSTGWSVESGRYKIGVPSLAGGVVVCLE